MMEDIPFKCIGLETWHKLANKLDPDSPLKGNNWKMLAEKLGYSHEQILNIECRHASHGRNTLKLFEDYVKKINSTVGDLKQAIESMDRPDALDVLIDALPEIQMRYQTDLHKQQRLKMEPGEHSFICSNESCSMMTHPSWNSQMSRHGYPTHHHHHHPPPMHVNVRPQVCSSQHHSYNSHYPSAHPSCSSNMNSDMNTDMSMNPRTGTRIQKELNAPMNYQYGHPSAFSVPHHRRVVPGFESMTSGVTESMSPSMEVNMDHTDRSYTNTDVDMSDMSVPHMREEPAPIARTMYRGEHCLESLSRVQPNLVHPSDMNVACEEIVGTSTSPVPMQKSHIQHAQKRQYHSQVSEEINTNQPINELNSQQLRHSGDRKMTLNLPSGGKIKKGDFISPSPTTPATPLAKLQQFADSEAYMPNKEYNTIMEEKNREEMMYNKPNNLDDCMSRQRDKRENGHNHVVVANRNREELRDIFNFPTKNMNYKAINAQHYQHGKQVVTVKEPPRTFPLIRAKMPMSSLTTSTSTEMSDEQSSSNLIKSQSVPHDMKPAEYHRAFWHIKVFVTYSGESKRHIQKVLNLSRCLEKNGFTCCMDMFEHKMDVEDKIGWCNQRFQEADFILVCVSSHYKQEALGGEVTGTENMRENILHTSYIYKLMESEFQCNQEHNRRFIPLMFDGATDADIPDLMQNSLKYHWPKQYRDLLWFLTKPETRIKREDSSSSDQESVASPKSPHSPLQES